MGERTRAIAGAVAVTPCPLDRSRSRTSHRGRAGRAGTGGTHVCPPRRGGATERRRSRSAPLRGTAESCSRHSAALRRRSRAEARRPRRARAASAIDCRDRGSRAPPRARGVDPPGQCLDGFGRGPARVCEHAGQRLGRRCRVPRRHESESAPRGASRSTRSEGWLGKLRCTPRRFSPSARRSPATRACYRSQDRKRHVAEVAHHETLLRARIELAQQHRD